MLWYNLLYYWSFKRTEIGSGLTLPHLIGADFLVNKIIPDSTIYKLIELNENKIDAILSIRKCPQIGEYIIQLNEKTDLPSLSYYKKIDNIFVTDKILETKKTIEELAVFFDEKYMDIIRAHRFTSRDGLWKEFNEKEKTEVKTCFNKSYSK